MNGNGEAQPQNNKNIIFLVVLTLAVAALIGITTFAYCMVFGVKPDGVIITAFAGIVGSCFGYLAGILSKTSPTETTKHVDVSNAPVITDADKPPMTP
jgi:uncharacterized membrane protein YeaQ/YmgE (transglycosylase-associated protein family)